MAVLEVKGVTKIYSDKRRGRLIAAENVNMAVNGGEIVGFIGPNGAGKSTTIKIITGLASATEGTVKINGYDINGDRIKAMGSVGCIVENPDLYRDWSAVKNLTYLMSLQPFNAEETEGLTAKEFYLKRAEELLALVGLSDRKNDPVRKYSLGMKQRLGIAQALLNRPSLLILDEPTNGLDPAGIKEVRDILRKLAKEYNMAILVSSHLLAEMQMMCDRYVIINKGKIIGNYTQEDINESVSNSTVILLTDDIVKAKDVLETKMDISVEILGNGKVKFSTDLPVNEIAKTLIIEGVTVLGINKKEVSLEEFFMNVTDKDRKEDNGKNV